jgi:hypothetical protein
LKIVFLGKMKKIVSVLVFVGLVATGFFWVKSSNAQSELTTVISQTNTVLRRDNSEPLYYLTGDQISDDAFFIGQRRVSAFSVSYRAVAPVNATFRFYNYSLTAPIVFDPEEVRRLRERGQLVKEVTLTNLPAGDHVRTVNLSTAEQFVWGTPPDRELASVLGFETDQTRFGGAGLFTVQFTDVNGNSSGTAAGSLIVSPANFRPFPRQVFAEYSSNSIITNVTQSDRPIFDREFYPVPDGVGGADLGLYLNVSGVNVTAPPPPPVTPTPTPTPAPSLSSVTLSSSSVRFGTVVTGTVNLTAPAPNGATVVLSSSNQSAAAVPATVRIAPGARSATFTVTTTTLRQNNYVVIYATFEGLTRTTTLEIRRR